MRFPTKIFNKDPVIQDRAKLLPYYLENSENLEVTTTCECAEIEINIFRRWIWARHCL